MRITKSYYLFILLFLVFGSLLQINGCGKSLVRTDNNTDEDLIPDSIVVYKPLFKFNLPVELEETSGLIFFNKAFYSHNDSDSESILYRFDTLNGVINQRVSLLNGINTDWEDLAQDDDYIYIGDFGNNEGNRKNLKVYKLLKSLISANGNIEASVESIEFSYEDQIDFSPAYNNNDFDCEAMIAYGDNLYLFSKNWKNQKCCIYSLTKIAGLQQAKLISEFDANCLISGASINSDATEIALIGYVKNSWIPVMWLLKDFSNGQFLSGTKLRFELLTVLGSQLEGIAFTDDNKLFISTEKTNLMNQGVFQLQKSRKDALQNNN